MFDLSWLEFNYAFSDLDYEFSKLMILKEFEDRQSEVQDIVIDVPAMVDHAPSNWI